MTSNANQTASQRLNNRIGPWDARQGLGARARQQEFIRRHIGAPFSCPTPDVTDRSGSFGHHSRATASCDQLNCELNARSRFA
jgi:hypothetical protein